MTADLEASRHEVGSWGHRSIARARLVAEFAAGRVLDVGCSTDVYTAPIAAEGGFAVGVDLLEPMSTQGVPFLVGDALALPFRPGAFDAALCFETLEHVPHPELALREVGRVASRVVLTVPNCDEPDEFKVAGLAFHHWVDRTHVNFFDRSSLRDLLEQEGWVVRWLGLINPVAPEVLALTSWHLPVRLARWVGAVCKRLPLRRRYYMTIAAVADRSVE